VRSEERKPSPAQTAASKRSETDWRLVLFGLAIATYAAFQQFKLPPVLPEMIGQYGYDRLLAGGFMSVYALAGLLLSIPLIGWIGRWGAHRVLSLAFLLMLLSCAATLLLPESGWLVLLARGLEGVAFSVCAVVGPALVNASAGPRHLPLMIGLTATWIPFGQLFATGTALLAPQAGDWQFSWWVAIAVTLGFLAWHLSSLGRGLPRLGNRGAAADSRAMTAEEKRLLWVGGVTFLIFSGQYIAYMTWLPYYLIQAFGLSQDQALYAYLAPVAFLPPMNFVAGWLMRRGVSCALLTGIGMAMSVLCWLVPPFVENAVLIGISLLIYGIASGLAPAGLFGVPNAVLGPRRSTVAAFGILMTTRNFGILAGPLLLGGLMTERGEWSVAAPVFAAVSLLAVGLSGWLLIRLEARKPAG